MTSRNLTKLIFLLSIAGLVGCSQDVQFAELPVSEIQESPQIPEDTVVCEPGQVEVVVPTKVVFVVDQSGSNINGPFGFPGLSTDPTKSFRYGVMSSFFQEHATKQHVSWGFVAFNGNTAKGLINNGDINTPHFSSNATDVLDAFGTFANSTDVGVTPYKAALTMVQGMIQRDLPQALPGTRYLVAFITDGHPTDYCVDPSSFECPNDVREAELDADVLNLVNTAPEKIQFGTVYYGISDSAASQRLARMAAIGGGQFVDTNTSGSIALNDVVEVPRPICQ